MAEELGERTEAPTTRRREDARDRGQVAKSTELSAGIDLVGIFVLLLVLGASLVAGFAGVMRYVLDARLSGAGTRFDHVERALEWTLAHTGVIVAPVVGVLFVVALISQILQVGIHFSPDALTPKLDRLNPIRGLGRIFSRRSLVKGVLNSVKIALVCAILFVVIRAEWESIAALAVMDLRPGLGALVDILARVCAWLIALILILGIADFSFQRWQHTRDLRMTKQEVKDEQRQMEGDLEVKGRRLRMARQIALQRIRHAVPTADVIVTNPTHFAVALKYESGKMTAPRVVAKGADFLAFRIRELGAASNIPVVERPPLARALYYGVPVGRQIAPEFYEAVAEILAYVYRLSNKAA